MWNVLQLVNKISGTFHKVKLNSGGKNVWEK